MGTGEKMNLRQWMDAVGVSDWDLAKRAGVTMQCIRRAELPEKNGRHAISLRKAQAICAVLSKEHGAPVRVADVKDLTTI